MTKLQVQVTKATPTKPNADTAVNLQELQLHHVEARRKRLSCLSWCGLVVLVAVVLAGLVAVFGLVYWFISYPDCDVTPQPTPAALQDKSPFSFEDIFDPQYRPKSFSGFWTHDEQGDWLVYRGEDGSVYKDDGLHDENRTMLLNSSVLESYSTTSYYFSHDLTYALLAYDIQAVWRYSFHAKYVIINIGTGVETPFPNSTEHTTLQYARWAPSSHDVVFVVGNDLYYQHGPRGTVQRITTDGSDTRYNGVPDWLYEEDVISSNSAHYWSPDSTHLVYATFDNADVMEQEFPKYGDVNDVYGHTVSIHYPKAGYIVDGKPGPNTEVELSVVHMSDLTTKHKIEPPAFMDEFNVTDFYYTRVEWVDNHHVYIVWTNRLQNEAKIQICDVRTPVTCHLHRHIQSEAWIDAPFNKPHFIDDGARYLSIFPSNQSEGETWRHLQLADLTGDEPVFEFLTSGHQEVTSLVGLGALNGDTYVYFISTNGDPTERHLMRVRVPDLESDMTTEAPESTPPPQPTTMTSQPTTTVEDVTNDGTEEDDVESAGSRVRRSVVEVEEPDCLTCDLEEGCRYVSAVLSPSGSLFILRCLGPDVPTHAVRDANNNAEVRVLEPNSELREALNDKLLPVKKYATISLNIADENYEAQVHYFEPPNFESSKSYPLLVDVYGGPGSQSVNKRFELGSTIGGWMTHLKSEHQVIVAAVDGRGSGLKGEEFRHLLYRGMGTVEIHDQITGGKWLRGRDFVNSDKNSAIFGWSYGGMASSLALAHSEDTFNCALAVAPTSSMEYYDTAYTERYMGYATEEDNLSGYNNTVLMNKVHNFRDKHFFLAHGTADDNVHFMHTAQLVRALAEEEIQYKYHMYVDEDHGIRSRHQSRHLYRAMTDFLVQDCFRLDEVEEPPASAAAILRPLTGAILALCILARNVMT